jgi:hypothetical protein
MAFSVVAFAQGQDNVRAELSMAFAVPQGDFADNVDDLGIGVTALLGGRIPGSPLTLGTEIGFLNYGTAEQLQVFNLADVPVEVLDVGISTNMVLGHLVARLQPSVGAFQPYIEGLAGVKFFSTRTGVEGDFIIDGRYGTDNNFDAVANVNDWAFSLGGGAGLDLALFSGPMGFEGERGSVALNLGVRYLFGTEAEYVSRAGIRQVEGQLLFEVRESRTDLIMPTAGIRVKF